MQFITSYIWNWLQYFQLIIIFEIDYYTCNWLNICNGFLYLQLICNFYINYWFEIYFYNGAGCPDEESHLYYNFLFSNILLGGAPLLWSHFFLCKIYGALKIWSHFFLCKIYYGALEIWSHFFLCKIYYEALKIWSHFFLSMAIWGAFDTAEGFL